ncbi:hypothetical protein A2300_03995 [Candidatus Falkowbacteria bacterium RIFOXYB2_FULL_35_7]|nr:MAG: hypothetical protein A2300_03995 [Candidatus Falkowbacteria bacterium RIFOXYB2_FULL_35_7]
MSGGSLDYAYQRVDTIIYKLRDMIFDMTIPENNFNNKARKVPKEYRKFIAHLEKVSQVLHDLEWAESGDTSEDAGIKSINRFFKKQKQ